MHRKEPTHLCLSADYQRCEAAAPKPDAWHSVYVTYFPAHCAGVTNISPHYNLSPPWRRYCQHRHMTSSSTSHKDYRLVYLFWLIPVFDDLHTATGATENCICGKEARIGRENDKGNLLAAVCFVSIVDGDSARRFCPQQCLQNRLSWGKC